ncbi:phytanoyl-CoA dioxygenase family protein [Gammaproteobacteria bacterium]|nr:phytanoyl-CoA dioxygenase family protein [Gammaproteobacteria bacterium]
MNDLAQSFVLNTHDPVGSITPEMIEAFERDGVVLLREALSAEWLMLSEMGLARVLADSGVKKQQFFVGEDGEFQETVRNFDNAFEIRRLLFDSPIAAIMGRFMNSKNVWYYSDEFFIKTSGGNERTPWHQDTPYFPVAGSQITSIWITLDPLSKDECLEFVVGSHKETMFDGFDPRNPGDPTSGFYNEGLPILPDIEANRDDFPIVSWELAPGDIILSSPSTIHGGGPTHLNSQRRALAVRTFGDDVVLAERPSSQPTVPLTPGLSIYLKPGDPLRSPWYPRLRPVPKSESYGA